MRLFPGICPLAPLLSQVSNISWQSECSFHFLWRCPFTFYRFPAIKLLHFQSPISFSDHPNKQSWIIELSCNYIAFFSLKSSLGLEHHADIYRTLTLPSTDQVLVLLDFSFPSIINQPGCPLDQPTSSRQGNSRSGPWTRSSWVRTARSTWCWVPPRALRSPHPLRWPSSTACDSATMWSRLWRSPGCTTSFCPTPRHWRRTLTRQWLQPWRPDTTTPRSLLPPLLWYRPSSAQPASGQDASDSRKDGNSVGYRALRQARQVDWQARDVMPMGPGVGLWGMCFPCEQQSSAINGGYSTRLWAVLPAGSQFPGKTNKQK